MLGHLLGDLLVEETGERIRVGTDDRVALATELVGQVQLDSPVVGVHDSLRGVADVVEGPTRSGVDLGRVDLLGVREVRSDRVRVDDVLDPPIHQDRIRIRVEVEEWCHLADPLHDVTYVDDLRLAGDAVGDERLDLPEAQSERGLAQRGPDRDGGLALVGRLKVLVAQLGLLGVDDRVPAHAFAVVQLGGQKRRQPLLDDRRYVLDQELRLADVVGGVGGRHRRRIAVGEDEVQLLPGRVGDAGQVQLPR